MNNIKLALDWTPNVNHIGFFIAKEMGFYAQHDIELEILNPADDNYQITPGKKLENHLADFAITPFETVISLNNKKNKVNALAVYAILQKDLSCIATLITSNLTSPKDLDHKIYASYKARYEDFIVKQMIINDKGLGNIEIVYPEKLGIWNTLLDNKADATWIFDNWEGIEALSNEIELNKFVLADYRIPYGYSPVLIAKKELVDLRKNEYVNFIKATKQGFLFTQENLTKSVSILKKYVTQRDLERIDLEKSIQMSSDYFGNQLTCGRMEQEKVDSFLNWLVENNIEDSIILKQKLFTNELIISL
jgi:ABC-type nitrate/sulfonate/bicarbonate transport system substrate-binding protein